ncbi:MAG: SIMPL domain-containing protein, partial [Dehalococcoidales bacterium]
GDFIRIDGISFTVDDPTPFQAEARQEAMADAAAKAEELAELAGVRLGKATFISESSAGQPPVPVLAEMAVMSAAVSTPISPGEVEIRVTVQVVYEIR